MISHSSSQRRHGGIALTVSRFVSQSVEFRAPATVKVATDDWSGVWPSPDDSWHRLQQNPLTLNTATGYRK